MQHLIQPNPASCFATCAAMISNRSVEQVFAQIGHDGMAIEWPELSPPMCYRGFHPIEISDYLLKHRIAMVEFNRNFAYGPDADHMKMFEDDFFINRLIDNDCAIVGYLTWRNVRHFAVVQNCRVYDPSGKVEDLNQIRSRIEVAFLIFRIKSVNFD